MAFSLRWVGSNDAEQIARTRLLCYGSAAKELDRFRDRLARDTRASAGDYLLAEADGQPVGTATHYPMTLWARGSAFSTQGVAWVGAIKTMRRKGKGTPGVASVVMSEILRRARDDGNVLTALMPFRASFYEHFGYGIVEHRNEWTLPLSTLPTADFDGVRFYDPADFEARFKGQQATVQAGQCDIERLESFARAGLNNATDGLEIIDRPDPAGPAQGAMLLTASHVSGKDHLKITDHWYADVSALKRQLNFLSSLRDQYSVAHMILPTDVPLHWLLKESQLPHRPVNHATADVKQTTRLQVRVLKHEAFLGDLHLPSTGTGTAVVGVAESEGNFSRFAIDLGDGRMIAKPSEATPTFECTDRVWAAVACGGLPATTALRLGLATGTDAAAACLDGLSIGPAPFCHEAF